MADIINPILSEDAIIPGDGPHPVNQDLYSASRLVEEYFERKKKQPQLSDREIQEQLEGDFKLSMEITEKMVEKLKSMDIEVIYVYWRFNGLGDYGFIAVINENDFVEDLKITFAYDYTEVLCNQFNNSKFDIDIGFFPDKKSLNHKYMFYDGYRLIYDGKRSETT